MQPFFILRIDLTFMQQMEFSHILEAFTIRAWWDLCVLFTWNVKAFQIAVRWSLLGFCLLMYSFASLVVKWKSHLCSHSLWWMVVKNTHFSFCGIWTESHWPSQDPSYEKLAPAGCNVSLFSCLLSTGRRGENLSGWEVREGLDM